MIQNMRFSWVVQTKLIKNYGRLLELVIEKKRELKTIEILQINFRTCNSQIEICWIVDIQTI